MKSWNSFCVINILGKLFLDSSTFSCQKYIFISDQKSQIYKNKLWFSCFLLKQVFFAKYCNFENRNQNRRILGFHFFTDVYYLSTPASHLFFLWKLTKIQRWYCGEYDEIMFVRFQIYTLKRSHLSLSAILSETEMIYQKNTSKYGKLGMKRIIHKTEAAK